MAPQIEFSFIIWGLLFLNEIDSYKEMFYRLIQLAQLSVELVVLILLPQMGSPTLHPYHLKLL